MTVQLTHCDIGAVKSSPTVGWQLLPLPAPHHGSFCWKAALLHCACGLYRTRFEKKQKTKTVLCKGSLPQVYQALLTAPLLKFCFQCAGKESCLIVFERLMVKGPTDTTTVGLQLCSPHLVFFTESKREEITAGSAGFYPAFSPLLAASFVSLCTKQLRSFLFLPAPPYTRSIPACLCSKCTYCPQYPFCLLLCGLHGRLQWCHTKDLFTRGKGIKHNSICVTSDAMSMHCISL